MCHKTLIKWHNFLRVSTYYVCSMLDAFAYLPYAYFNAGIIRAPLPTAALNGTVVECSGLTIAGTETMSQTLIVEGM